LKALLVGLPLWWALGLGVFGFLIAALAMGVQLYRWRPLRVPAGFGVWVLFLVWTLGTVTVLWARAPQTLGGGGVERLLPFALRGAWYVAITIAMLYPLNIPAAKVSNKQFVRWMALVFAYCILLGIVAMAFPRLEFTSVAERLLPGGQGSFLQSMTHPRLATTSGFLGYEQPRPSAPFLYANTWGNNVGLLLPFFVFAWMRIVSTWKKFVGAVVGLLAVLPIVYSLNRGLWLALGVLAVYVGVILARQRKFAILWAAAVLGVIALTGVAASPVGQTFTTRLETPHSNERRGDLATTTISVTATGSPVVGYGSTRKLAGSFSSVAGGRSVDCEKCDVPPLGTQGYPAVRQLPGHPVLPQRPADGPDGPVGLYRPGVVRTVLLRLRLTRIADVLPDAGHRVAQPAGASRRRHQGQPARPPAPWAPRSIHGEVSRCCSNRRPTVRSSKGRTRF
jgi:hypothetical protein